MDIQILKIKPWMIKFRANNQIYFIKQIDESCSNGKQLWKYIPLDNNGHYKTEYLEGSYGDLNVRDFVPDRHPGQTYSQIDTEKFCAALAWYNFGEILGMSENEIKEYKTKRQIIMCEEKIKDLEQKLGSERLRLFILTHPEEYDYE